MLSVLIAARNEKYLERTINDVLSNAEGEIEVLVMLDGWIPDPQIIMNDNRVIFHHFKDSIGQRQCINEGARLAQGKYIMKLDAHCAVDKGFDIKLAADCGYNWTVVPRMYNLDHETWLPKKHKRTDYMYITSPTESKPFRATYYGSKQPKNDKMIDDTMACMGPCWFMHKDRFWELGGCDEGHGSWGAQSVEVSLKAWLSGGSLKVNKNTWFAHYFRKKFPYSASGREHERARKYSRDLWLNNKWEKQVRPLQWLIEKFNPPTWATIIYYTSNQETPAFEKKITDSLIKQSKGLPIISVSHKPMDLGTNICVGDIPVNEESLLAQILTGLKAAKTKFCIAAESDFIYPPEYFTFVPPRDDQVYRFDNVWVRWTRTSKFYKKYYSEGAQICDRLHWIKAIESTLAKTKEGNRVFRSRLDYKWGSNNPAVSFKTGKGLHGKAVQDRSFEPTKSLPYWKDCREFVQVR